MSHRVRSDEERKAMYANMNQGGKNYHSRNKYSTDSRGYATANKVQQDYKRPKEIGPLTKETVTRVKNKDTTKKIAKNMWTIEKPYKLKYEGTYTTTIMMERKGKYYYYDIPTDKNGKIPERVACGRLLDTFDGDRQKHHRSVMLDVGIDAEKRWDANEKKHRAEIYRWFLHPNESDIKLIDDKNTKILEILKQNKSGRRAILISGGTDEQREAVAQAIEKNFTVKEKRIIAGNLITIGKTPPGVAGYYSQQHDASHHPIGCAEVRINPRYSTQEDTSVVIHECIHLLREHDKERDPHLRATKKYVGRDADLEESMTEAETVSRERPMQKDKSSAGYYQYIKHKDKTSGELIIEDRITINNPKDKDKYRQKGKKGKSAQKALQKNYPKSNISKLKNKGDAEAIDSYYKLDNRVDGEKTSTEVHTYAPKQKSSEEKKEDAVMRRSAQNVTKYNDKKAKKIK